MPGGAPAFHIRRAPHARTGLVLLHGVMSHAGWFASLAEELAVRGVSTVAVDRRGSGAAKLDLAVCDASAWAADIDAAVADLRTDHDRVALLGWCWGARSAIVAAARVPVDHLVLAAPGLAMTEAVRTRAAELAATGADPVDLPFPIEAFSDDAAVVAWIHGDTHAWTAQPRAFLPVSRALLDEALATIPKLRIPVTAFFAEHDRIVDNARTMELLRGHRIETLAGGHALVLESPTSVAERIAATLAT